MSNESCNTRLSKTLAGLESLARARQLKELYSLGSTLIFEW